ncbi:DUF6148 family protein [Bacillaceae bacterium IKA-2]|nr:DUF6148 family protein [Bacillaceae bacterium IKA-2]
MSVLNRLKIAEERLATYYEAEIKVLSGQEYRIGTRSLKRADLNQIKTSIKELEIQVSKLKRMKSGGGALNIQRPRLRDW